MAAESILSAFLPVILEKLISPAIQQLGVAFGTNDKLKKLKRILERIEPVLVDAEERQTTDISIKNWLSNLKDAAYEAEDVLEDFDFEAERKQRSVIQENNMGRKVRPYCSFYRPVMTCFGLRRRLNDIIRKIEAIAEESDRFNFHLSKVPRISYYSRPQTHSYVDKETVIGREKDKEDIKLPENLTDLVNLRHLYTDGCSSLACMPRKMERLKQLRTLTMYIVSNEAERGLEQLHNLNLYGKLQLCGIEKQLVIKNCEKLSIIPSLSQMQDLCLSNCQSLVHLPPCLPSVRNLIIDQCNTLESLPEPGNNLPELQILKLHQCDGLASLPQRMESLNILDISKCNQLTSLPMGLTNLHTLILEQCHGLVYLPNDMESLADLKIIKCNGLTSLPKGLTKLHSLVLVRCDGLVSLSEAMEEGLNQLQSLSISECNGLTSLPMGLTKLNTLVLAACDGLASLPEGMEGLTQLQRLTISDCNGLRSLPEGLQQRLPNLTSLIIGGHDELIRRFQLGGDYWHLIVNISSRNILKPRV
ncbi:hypothetical protein M5K25_006444 [Dendrobium thyrsiflorum]|uniref:Disease resistance N-terminal domain-containing protein n=1 Tax=Dendrobium thyrsiflorum TaxID=117978 RepID=A0ABD0VCW5_DENTH